MAKNRKISVAVRRQIADARTQDAGETTVLPSHALMAQARMAGRKLKRQVLAERLAESGVKPVKLTGRVIPRQVTKHVLTKDGLVTVSKAIIGFRLGEVPNPFVPVAKGEIGVLVARDIWRMGSKGVIDRRGELCHVMLSTGIVELPVSSVRDVGNDEEEGAE